MAINKKAPKLATGAAREYLTDLSKAALVDLAYTLLQLQGESCDEEPSLDLVREYTVPVLDVRGDREPTYPCFHCVKSSRGTRRYFRHVSGTPCPKGGA